MRPVHYVMIFVGAIVLVGGTYLLLSRDEAPSTTPSTGGGGGGGGGDIAGAAGAIGQGAGSIIGSIADLVNSQQQQAQRTTMQIRAGFR
jgi:hypothetical protein